MSGIRMSYQEVLVVLLYGLVRPYPPNYFLHSKLHIFWVLFFFFEEPSLLIYGELNLVTPNRIFSMLLSEGRNQE